MMQTFDDIEASDVQIERLAAVVERSRTYSQYQYSYDCRTPACLLGHWEVLNGRPLEKSYSFRQWERAGSELGVEDSCELNEFFGVHGCNNAGRSGAKAARFLRDWMDGRHWAYAARCRSAP